MEKLLLSPEEVAEALVVRRSFVYERLLATGVLPSLKLRRRRLIAVDDLEQFIVRERERQATGNARKQDGLASC